MLRKKFQRFVARVTLAKVSNWQVHNDIKSLFYTVNVFDQAGELESFHARILSCTRYRMAEEMREDVMEQIQVVRDFCIKALRKIV